MQNAAARKLAAIVSKNRVVRPSFLFFYFTVQYHQASSCD